MDYVKELERYIVEEYKGDLVAALESIGGIIRVRNVLGWPRHAVLDHRLYEAPEQVTPCPA